MTKYSICFCLNRYLLYVCEPNGLYKSIPKFDLVYPALKLLWVQIVDILK